MNFPTLETERLVLRSPHPNDVEGFADLLSDPTCYPYITDSGPVVRSAVPERIRQFAAGYRLGRSIHWVLELRSNRAFAGYVAVHGFREAPAHLSFAIHRSLRRQGFAREAVAAVRMHLQTLGCETLVAHAHADNASSRGLLSNLGFEEIGLVSTERGERIEYRWPASEERSG